jgi:CBS domain-containing protein
LDLLKSSIFFDFRLGYGDQKLVDELRKHLFGALSGWVGFFRHLSENALEFKPPLDFFGKISLVSKGAHQNTVDIKSAMNIVVDFARIYALFNRIPATNTFERLKEMLRLEVLQKQDHDDLAYVYGILMQMRLTHQAKTMIEKNQKPNNFLNPKSLSYVEQQTLREAIKHLKKAQGKLSMDFSGWYTGIG